MINKKRLKKLVVIIAILVFCLSLLYYFLGESSGNPIRLRLNLTFHKTEYNEVANNFLKQNIIKNIALHDGWEIVNGCSNHPDNGGEWQCFEGGRFLPSLYPNQKKISFKDFNAVLDYLDVPKDKYSYFTNFLHKYHFSGIGKDDEKKYVELADKLNGLRYYEQENSTDFVVDKEFLDVKKIDVHWFLFYRDWN